MIYHSQSVSSLALDRGGKCLYYECNLSQRSTLRNTCMLAFQKASSSIQSSQTVRHFKSTP